MGGVDLLERARDAGLTVCQEGEKLVVRGPRSQEPLALELLAHKPEVIAALKRTNQDSFVQWMLGMWVEASRPTWRKILAAALEAGDQKRARFATHMISEVLRDDPDA